MYKQPEARRSDLLKEEDRLGQLAWVLDDMFRIPGLNWRFGLDSVIGLIPGGGDIVTASVSLLILFRAFQYQIPPVIILRMIVNTLLDLLLGAIPLAGDLFDFAWKSNSMNMRLFRQFAREPQQSTMRHWIFLTLIAFLFLAVFVLISAGVYYLLMQSGM